MTLKSQIEVAKDAVGKALIAALENKDTGAIGKLMSCYTSLNTITITEPIKIDLGIYTNNYESYNIPCSSMNDDVITFSGLG
jgi:hypothetical protein